MKMQLLDTGFLKNCTETSLLHYGPIESSIMNPGVTEYFNLSTMTKPRKAQRASELCEKFRSRGELDMDYIHKRA